MQDGWHEVALVVRVLGIEEPAREPVGFLDEPEALGVRREHADEVDEAFVGGHVSHPS